MHKIGQSGRFLDGPLESLLKTGLPLMKNILEPLAKRFVVPLGLTVQQHRQQMRLFRKKMFGCGMTTLTISKEEMNDIIKIVKPLEQSILLIKDISERHEAKEQKGGFLSMLFGT